MLSCSGGISERERVQKALIQAQKLESLGTLAGGVAHDFNNVLVSLLGQTAFAARKLSADHPAHRHLDKVNQAGGTGREACQANVSLLWARRFLGCP